MGRRGTNEYKDGLSVNPSAVRAVRVLWRDSYLGTRCAFRTVPVQICFEREPSVRFVTGRQAGRRLERITLLYYIMSAYGGLDTYSSNIQNGNRNAKRSKVATHNP